LVRGRAQVRDTGDIAWFTFPPNRRHQQSGHRPALVLSPAAYNGRTSMMICCPMTTQIKGYPFEVLVSRPPSVVLADQVKSFDSRARRPTRTAKVPDGVLAEVRAKVRP